MTKARETRVRWRVFAAALVVASLGVSVAAQETVPTTPPELKDFRLDTPPPKQKAPEPSPPVAQPAPQPAAETPRSQPAPQPRAKGRTVDQPVAETKADTPSPAAIEPPATVEEAAPVGEVAPRPVAEPAEVAPATSWLSESMRFWPLLLALLAGLAGLFGWRAWKNRPLPAREAIVIPSEPDFTPAPPPAPIPAVPAPVRGTLTASFEPAEARLSVANLTITGCLRLRYEGEEPLQSLRLRNMVISACDGQRALMEAFHNDASSGQIDMLGGIQPGEEIVLTLELQVPRDALQAFDWRERRFVAPILLLNVGSEDGSVAPCRINSLVGQRGDPASPKMQPLPVDRGPKLFESLQFQPIAA